MSVHTVSINNNHTQKKEHEWNKNSTVYTQCMQVTAITTTTTMMMMKVVIKFMMRKLHVDLLPYAKAGYILYIYMINISFGLDVYRVRFYYYYYYYYYHTHRVIILCEYSCYSCWVCTMMMMTVIASWDNAM